MIDPTSPSAPVPSSTSPSPSPDYAPFKSDSRFNHYNFTPKISKSVPRVWERRPATPFAPRTTSHKIWKRCETMGTQRHAGIRKDNAQSGMWRAVKRMKVGEVRQVDEAGQENGDGDSVGTRYERLEQAESEAEVRRKVATAACCECSNDAAEKAKARHLFASSQPTRIIPPFFEIAEGRYNCYPPAAEEHQKGDGTLITRNESLTSAKPPPPRARDGKFCDPKVEAMFDGNASPASIDMKTNESWSRASGGEVATRTRSGFSRKPEVQKALNEISPMETQVVIDPHEDAPSTVGQRVEAAPKISFTTEGDDTEYLHAFLTRARAERAARTIKRPEKQASTDHVKATVSSAPTRSRTALTTLDKNSPSPQKQQKREKLAEECVEEGTILPDMTATSPTRKGGRVRPPRPQRHQPAIPSSIPFRRSDGPDLITLEKTETQHLATKTKTNTRRNKGEAVQPKMKLEVLSSQTQVSPVKAARKRKSNKQVSWDEGLAYFAPEDLPNVPTDEEQTEAKTPVKRSRRLAAGKGTPAPKKQMAEASVQIETPRLRATTRIKRKT